MHDDTQTPTVFRTYPDGEVAALFPTIPADPNGNCSSYVHVGQHGAADPHHLISRTRPATPDEYAELTAELEAIGYAVRPVRRMTHRMVEERRVTTEPPCPRGS
ncbi:MAG: hypothetical protein ABFE08_16225 [Armatimonadia bacterium]